jgi:hypothetical protein
MVIISVIASTLIILLAILGATRYIINQLDRILEGERTIMADLSTLEADVAAETTVEKSAIALLTQLADLLKSAGTDPVKLAALHDTITANTAALAAAVTANTPAA